MSITPLSKLPHFDPRLVPVVGIDAHLPPGDVGVYPIKPGL